MRYDCWGLVREARDKHMGLSRLPLYGDLRNTEPLAFTKAYRSESGKLRECGPEHGAIAAVLIGNVCVHVALVLDEDGEFVVLEINPLKSARVVKLNIWLQDHVRVTYHND